MKPHHEHKAHAPTTLCFAIITVSDTRTQDTDESGRLIEELLAKAGHHVATRTIVPDDAARVRATVQAALASTADIVITTGGTGIAPRDVTLEAVTPLLEKRIHGFGELFRMLSHQSIGPAAMLSRADAGTARGKVIFLLPGSPDACALATSELILPEAAHAWAQATRRS